MQSMDRIHRYGLDEEGDIICAKYDTNIEILTCKNSIDQMIHTNLKRKMEAMYKWLNDPNESTTQLLEPLVSQKKLNNGDEESAELSGISIGFLKMRYQY